MLPNYPLTSKHKEMEKTSGWQFKRHKEVREWHDRIGVRFNSKLFALDKNSFPRMVKLNGIFGAVREILYSRICEKLGILCESAQFIILSEEHVDLAKGESYQAGIFLLQKSEPLGYWLDHHYKGAESTFIDYPVYDANIKNPDNYCLDQIANILFRQSEAGEYEVTPEGYLVRVDIDTIFSGLVFPLDEEFEGEEIKNFIRLDTLQIFRENCERELRNFIKIDARAKALKIVCQKVAKWTDGEIRELTDFPVEFQGTLYGPHMFRLITDISRHVARRFVGYA